MATFTGERPGRGATFAYDDSRHRAAYDALADLVAGAVVVDAGAGDGEGTAMLARTAARVIGLDHDEGAVEQATRTHGSPTTTFRRADLAEPWPVTDADVVVALQVIEHLQDDDAFVRHALAAVRPGGRVVITTPNRLRSFSENPWHVREYTAAELRRLLARHGDDVTIRGVFGNDRVAAYDARRREEVERWLRLDPWRLRDRLPRQVVVRAFAVLSRLVRLRAGRGAGTDDAPIRPDDFTVADGPLDDSLDLFAVVRRTAG